MRIFVFTNEQNTFKQEFHTDFLTGMDNFTVHDIQFSSATLTQDNLTAFGLNFERLPYTYAAFKAFAVTNNLTLTEIDYNDTSGTSLNAATAFSITTTAIKDGFTGLNDKQSVTFANTAGHAQGDYLLITNTNGDTLAAWIDIDAAGTEPTGGGTAFGTSDYQVRVPIITTGTAGDSGAAFVAAMNAVNTVPYNGWMKDLVTVTDDTAGATSIDQNLVADVTTVVEYLTGGGAGGGFTIGAPEQNGVDPVQELQTVTIDTFANMTTQADYVVVTNTQGEKLAVWVDLNANGTEPATGGGEAYQLANYTSRIDLVTGDNTADLAANKLYAALTDASVLAWNQYATIVNVQDASGDVTIEQINEGDITDAAEFIADGSAGAGRFTVAETLAGVGGTTYSEVIATTGGNTTITYALTPAGTTDLPAGLSFNTTTATLEGRPQAAQASVLDITFTDAFGVTDTDIFNFTINA